MSPLLHTPVCELLGCRLPIVLAGMGGVARSELVTAVTAAGGFGFLGMVREPAALLRREVEAVRAAGHARFGVNLIPAATAPELLEAEVAAVLDLKVPVVCLFWDIDRALVRRLTDAGILVVYQVGSVEEGIAARDAGARVLIAQGVEAGGHVRGTTPLQHLLPALVAAVDVPVLAAGGIGTGADLVTALALGAAGVVLGTALITTRESFAHDFHKERLLAADPGSTVLTEAFHVNWPAHAHTRVLASDITSGRRGDPQTAERTVIGWEEGRPIYLFSTDSPLRSMTGDFGSMALYAGMGVGRQRKMQPAAARLEAIVRDAEALLEVTGGATAERSSPVCYAADADPEYMGFLGRAALAERLAGLRDALRAAFAVARREGVSGERQVQQARWVVLVSRLATRFGASAPSGDGAALPDSLADAEAVVLTTARALITQIAEADVRAVVAALIVARSGGEKASPLRVWTGVLPA